MSLYDRLGVRTLINAADSYTILGGSRLPDEVREAMAEASRSFVWIEELHDKVGERLAEITNNEAAMVTSGAAAGLAVAAAACIAGADIRHTRKFPELTGMKKEVILHRSQRNGFDLAISQIGARIVEIGDVESTSPWQLEEAITPDTACIMYFSSSLYSLGALPLEKVIAIARPRGIPVVVDAAAQLPPVDNLWNYTRMGADLVIFSGGKTLRGPQSSGFIVGRRDLIEACRMHVGPKISIGRPMKVGKEEMAGLLAAVERYVRLDHQVLKRRYESDVETVCRECAGYGYGTRRIYPGPTGQDYPLAAVRFPHLSAEQLKQRLASSDPSIIVSLTRDKEDVLINPLHLEPAELEQVLARLKEIATD